MPAPRASSIKFPVNTLADYEQELYSYIEANEPSIFTELNEKQELSALTRREDEEDADHLWGDFQGNQGPELS